MKSTLVPLKLPPGLYRNGTRSDAMGRWYDSNHVRWVEGLPQPVGGWRRTLDSGNGHIPATTGVPRAVRAWRASSGVVFIGVGTNEKLHILSGGQLSDVTPVDLTAGNEDSVLVGGTYGAGAYGAGPYGAGSGALTLQEADTWQLDTFGDYLVGVLTSDGRIHVWQGDTGVVAAPASGAPVENRALVVTPERFLVALGAGGNLRKVQWPSQESYTDWTPTSENTAGDFELATEGRIMCGARTTKETLIWTDTDLHTMNHIGGTLVYSFDQAGDKCGIISPNAKVTIETQAYWMGRDGFYVYDGFVQKLPCDVYDYVFENMNRQAAAKFWAMTISAFSEIRWYYCSAGATEIDRYVVYNTLYKHWYVGRLERTAGSDTGALDTPIMYKADGTLWDHEVGEGRDGEDVYLESGPIELDPDYVMRIDHIVADGNALGDATMSIYTSMWPIETETLRGPYSLTNPTDVRLTARRIRLRIDENDDVSWRVGVPKLAVQRLGRR